MLVCRKVRLSNKQISSSSSIGFILDLKKGRVLAKRAATKFFKEIFTIMTVTLIL